MAIRMNRIADQSGMVSDMNSHEDSEQSPFASNMVGHHRAIGRLFRSLSSGLIPHSNDSG
jgi:hypothetical protein